MFYTYITSVSSGCCICFPMATHVFSWCFRRMLQVFQLFRTYVASISSKCCKTRFDVAHVAVEPIYRKRLLQLLGLITCTTTKKNFARRFGMFFGGGQHFQPPRLMPRINRGGRLLTEVVTKKPPRKIDLRRRAL
jgi:hypothetical protein